LQASKTQWIQLWPKARPTRRVLLTLQSLQSLQPSLPAMQLLRLNTQWIQIQQVLLPVRPKRRMWIRQVLLPLSRRPLLMRTFSRQFTAGQTNGYSQPMAAPKSAAHVQQAAVPAMQQQAAVQAMNTRNQVELARPVVGLLMCPPKSPQLAPGRPLRENQTIQNTLDALVETWTT